ncbi:ExeM/NucH family extracellular endonuclease [Gleimia hominis]|uniref:ExeM/NucH family extracellular endonuclease n=1 Tax=Gleimia hominis TaxID=595468 RepID=UPI000C80B909|nr:ExeM/NucH family extracellular endonuclease [Gleimia hominis]WIK63847.1 ExeM/NucH family extracellular endonuclease [Gleimia hominis]
MHLLRPLTALPLAASLVFAFYSPLAVAADPSETPDPTSETLLISDIQTAPKDYEDKQVTTSGVVTAVLEGRGGFTIQMPTSAVPSGYGNSQAVFVKVSADGADKAAAVANVEVGDAVTVTGQVDVPGGLTTLMANNVETTASDQSKQVNVMQVPAPKTDAEAQKLQSMAIAPKGKFRLADSFPLTSVGQLILTDGDKPPVQPTQMGRPGSQQAKAQAEYNAAHRVVIDDGSDAVFDSNNDQAEVTPPKHLPFMADGAQAGPTLGAEVSFKTPAIVTRADKQWVLDPTESNPAADEFVSFTKVSEAEPADVGGNLKVATFNVLNYFTSLGVDATDTDGDGKPLCWPTMNQWDQSVPVAGNWDCPRRGAWDKAGLKRQEDKIVAAINTLGRQGAAVIALQEIENDPLFQDNPNQSLKQLVNALNKADSAQGWNYVPTPKETPKYGAKDMIRQAFIYKPAQVSLVGKAKYLDDAAYQSAADARAPIAQVFEHKVTKRRVLVINNHLTYKGGTVVGEDNKNPGDTQGPAYDTGRNNGDRTRQAKALAGFAQREQASSKADFTLLVGDFNAYSGEDPIQVLKDSGYADLMNTAEHASKRSMTDWAEYTYSYGGMLGSLDHIMVSKTGMDFYAGHDIWTANAYESQAREYSRYMATGTDYYRPNVFRASDHNSAIIGFNLSKKAAAGNTDAPSTGNPDKPGSQDPNQPGSTGQSGSGSQSGNKPEGGNASGNHAGGHANNGRQIAKTGTDVAAAIALSLLTVVAGVGLYVLKRRKH